MRARIYLLPLLCLLLSCIAPGVSRSVTLAPAAGSKAPRTAAAGATSGRAAAPPGLRLPDLGQPGQALREQPIVRQGQWQVQGQRRVIRTRRFQHYIHDVEVIGSYFAFHEPVDPTDSSDPNDPAAVPARPGLRIPVQSQDRVIRVAPDTQPGFPPEKAASLARIFLSKSLGAAGASLLGKPVLKILPDRGRRSAKLIYWLEFEGSAGSWQILLDAASGELISVLPMAVSLVSDLRVHSAEKQGFHADIKTDITETGFGDKFVSCELTPLDAPEPGQVLMLDEAACEATRARSCQILPPKGLAEGAKPLLIHPEHCALVATREEGSAPKPAADLAADPAAKRALRNAERFLEYFRTVHRRDSYDDRGSPIVSVIHVGQKLDGASWYKRRHFLVYGDGDGVVTGDYTLAVDIAGHELTHGVIESTARLLNMGESGALNESLADFFGKMVENEGDWGIGKKLFLQGEPHQAIRDLADPRKLIGVYYNTAGEREEMPYPSARSDMADFPRPCLPSNDYCGIHFNATVPGHAWYLIHQAIGKQKAQDLLYLALTHYLGEVTGFAEAAEDVLQACSLLLPQPDCAQVRDAFVSTGML